MVLDGILSVVTSPECLLLILVGVFVGIVFGSIPGLSAVMAICLFLPLTFGMTAINGISLLLGLYIGGVSGGLISAILLKIPGTASSVATVFEGGPMADRGEGGKAIGAGILYSFIGGVLSIIALVLLAPFLAKFAVKFSSVEYAAVMMFSLTVIATLSGKNVIKGIIAGLFGILLSTVGSDPIGGFDRLGFGLKSMSSGFDTVSVMIGFFAISDVIAFAFNYAAEMEKPIIKTAKVKGFGVSLKEFKECFRCMIVSTILGIGIGILPGIGGGTANLVSYSAAQNFSKTPEKFGTGHLEGLVASETSNNATTGGSMVPMLTLGIPGSTSAAMLMSALMIHNVTPGPLIFRNNGRVVYAIFAALLVANLFMLFVERLALPVFVKLLSIPKNILLPCVVMMCTLGCYTSHHITFDVITMFVFGVIGLLMRKAKIPLGPCVIGFILGTNFETYLRRSITNNNGSLLPFFNSPIACIFIALAVLFCVIPAIRSRKKKQERR